ncbi:hypothetical protein CDIK_4258 [Cucumispora dikerogammari]|nr:hypothetical protein CDIK_4258 [Cucumispora dikerogammari]
MFPIMNHLPGKIKKTENKLTKLSRLITCFNKKFHQVYRPDREPTLDKNKCYRPGKDIPKVYTPLQASKTQYKVFFSLCKTKTGYACNIVLYNNKSKEKNLKIILRLSNNYKFLNRHIYMDNFYTM